MRPKISSVSAPVQSLGGAADILLAASLWATTGTARTYAPAGTSPVAVGAARIVVGGVLLFVLAMRSGELSRMLAERMRTRILLALGAICVAVYQTTFFAAVARDGVAIGTIVTIGTAPIFTGVLAYFTSGTRPGSRWMVSTTGAVAGCAALVTGGTASGVEVLGIGLALLAGMAYAIYAVTASRLIRGGFGDRAVMGVFFGGAAVLLTPVLFGSDTGWLLTIRGAAVVTHLAVFTTLISYVLYARGLRNTPVAPATTLGLVEPAIAALLGLVMLGEHLSGVALGGLGLLAISMVFLVIPTRLR